MKDVTVLDFSPRQRNPDPSAIVPLSEAEGKCWEFLDEARSCWWGRVTSTTSARLQTTTFFPRSGADEAGQNYQDAPGMNGSPGDSVRRNC